MDSLCLCGPLLLIPNWRDALPVSEMRNRCSAPCVKRYKERQAVILPVISLPVPEQQVSEPVPRGQREHLLFKFNHGSPPSKKRSWREIAPQTAPPDREGGSWNQQLRYSSFCYSQRKWKTNTLVRLMALSSASHLQRKIHYFLSSLRNNKKRAALLQVEMRQQVEEAHPSVLGGRGDSTLRLSATGCLSQQQHPLLPAWAPHGRTEGQARTERGQLADAIMKSRLRT